MEFDYNQIVNACLWTEVFLTCGLIKLAKINYSFEKEFGAKEKSSFWKSLKKILFDDMEI